jgi:hypothetical protein
MRPRGAYLQGATRLAALPPLYTRLPTLPLTAHGLYNLSVCSLVPQACNPPRQQTCFQTPSHTFEARCGVCSGTGWARSYSRGRGGGRGGLASCMVCHGIGEYLAPEGLLCWRLYTSTEQPPGAAVCDTVLQVSP